MTFQEIADQFSRSAGGTDQFKALYRGCFELMKTDTDQAVAYFVIGVAAQSYVRRYEDQGVPVEAAERAKMLLVSFNDRVLAALAQEPALRLKSLGRVAIDYEWGVEDF